MIMATPKYTERQVPLKNLLVDQNNPRLSDKYDNQNDTIQSMIKLQGEKLVELAKHIIENGFNPTNILLVSPSKDKNNGMFDVLDGNRRVTTLKLLDKPELAEGQINTSLYQRLIALSVTFKKEPITDVKCVIFKNKEDADIWIQLNHRGENKGAGLVEWDGQVAARYDAIHGDKSSELQILDFVKGYANLSPVTQEKIDNGKFPITTLERLIGSPEIRDKLGIEIKDKIVYTYFPDEEVSKGLTRIFNDLGDGKYNVSQLKSIEQRKDYINSFSSEELPSPDKKNAIVSPLDIKYGVLIKERELTIPKNAIDEKPNLDIQNGLSPTQLPAEAKKSSITRSKGGQSNRKTLIPKQCNLTIPQHRISNIYKELKKININDYPNASTVLFRVFIELSLDYFIDKNFISWTEEQKKNTKLKDKLTKVGEQMKQQGILTDSEFTPVRKAASSQTFLHSSVNSMNAYVHCMNVSPVASEMIVGWDDLQVFIQKLWQNAEQI
jgi:hypothetical protein